MLYISSGNLPSQWAHSIQIAKMSQAFYTQIKNSYNFELVTSGDFYSFLVNQKIDLKQWYGLTHDFPVTYLPIHLKLRYPLSKNYSKSRFLKLALIYAYFKSPQFVYTRTPMIVKNCLRLGIPVVGEFHDYWKDCNTNKYLLQNSNLLGIVLTSPNFLESYLEKGIPSEKILIEPNAVDLNIFFPYQSKEIARQYLSLNQKQKICIYVGHLYRKKGISILLKVAKLLPSYQFVLVGGWKEDVKEIEYFCHQNKLDNIKLTGHLPQKDIVPYLYAADVLLLASQKDTSPLKLFEYMASQRPIVASDISPIRQILKDNHNALLAEANDPVSFKNAIEQILINPELGNKLSQQAFKNVQHHTWEKRAERILAFLKK